MSPVTPRHRSHSARSRSAAVPTLAAVRQGLVACSLPVDIVTYLDDAYPVGVRTSLAPQCAITLTRTDRWLTVEEEGAGQDIADALLRGHGVAFAALDIAVQHVVVRALAELLRDKHLMVPLGAGATAVAQPTG
jgi:hypothetical protein